MKTIRLVACLNYHYFPARLKMERGKVYTLDAAVADVLLAKRTDYGLPYFEVTQGAGEKLAVAKPAPKQRRTRQPAPTPEKVEVEVHVEDDADPLIDEGAVPMD